MTTILAYCDPISAAPGDVVRFMVSCEGAPEYRAEIARLVRSASEALSSTITISAFSGWLMLIGLW